MQRGQTVLEFLFLVLVAIVYLTTIVVPMAKNAQSAISDTESMARANNETQKIANAVQKISLLGDGSRQTIDVFVPSNTIIRCTNLPGSISFDTNLLLAPFPAQCSQGTCTKTFLAGTTLSCTTTTLRGPLKASVQIQKTAGVVQVAAGS